MIFPSTDIQLKVHGYLDAMTNTWRKKNAARIDLLLLLGIIYRTIPDQYQATHWIVLVFFFSLRYHLNKKFREPNQITAMECNLFHDISEKKYYCFPILLKCIDRKGEKSVICALNTNACSTLSKLHIVFYFLFCFVLHIHWHRPLRCFCCNNL